MRAAAPRYLLLLRRVLKKSSDAAAGPAAPPLLPAQAAGASASITSLSARSSAAHAAGWARHQAAAAAAPRAWHHAANSLANSTVAAAQLSMPAGLRSFASVSSPVAHSGCGHDHGHGDECGDDEVVARIRGAPDMAALHALLQGGAASPPAAALSAAQAAAAFRRAAVLAGGSAPPATAAAVVAQLASAWLDVLPQATGTDLGGALLAWTKLQLQHEGLWQATLAAVAQQLKQANGQALANIAFALAATAEVNPGGGVPGVPHAQVQELLRAVTHEVVGLVSGTAAGDGSSGGRQVSVGNLATVRWANEVFEEMEQQQQQQQQQPKEGAHSSG